MELETFEFQGKTTEEAIEKACKELNLPKEKLEIEVIEPGSSGIFGIVGGKKSRIRVRIKERDTFINDGVAIATDALKNILKLFSMDHLAVRTENLDGNILLKIEGDNSGIIIGKGGKTLDALEFIINKIVNKKLEKKLQIILDAQNYRERRRQHLARLAVNMGNKAKKTGKPVSTDPLSPRDRRVIHLALKDDKGLETKSTGEGSLKKVIIIPKFSRNRENKRRSKGNFSSQKGNRNGR